MGAQVLGLEVVLPTGKVLSTRAVPKYSSGPNLNYLFIGSEGIFGIITKATLRVFRIPERRIFSTFAFPSFAHGFHAVVELFHLGGKPSLVDLSQEPGKGVLLYVMFEGYREGVLVERRRCRTVCRSFQGEDLGSRPTREYWRERYDTAIGYKESLQGLTRKERWERRRGRGFDYLHMALPVNRVLEYRERSHEILREYHIEVRECAIWGMPELFSILIVPQDDAAAKRLTQEKWAGAVDQVLMLAQDMGGTMEYCHGTGIKLAHLLGREWGVGLEVVQGIKQALDPNNIMNPGKLGL